jgi:Leucine-rich repeat (LRR) protein
MIDQHCVPLGSAKSLTELYVQADSSSEFAHTVKLLLYLAESLGYDADDPKFLSLRELKLPWTSIHDLRPVALFEKPERLDLSDNYVEDLSPLSGLRNLKWLKLETNLDN